MKIDSSVIGMESARKYSSTSMDAQRITTKAFQSGLGGFTLLTNNQKQDELPSKEDGYALPKDLEANNAKLHDRFEELKAKNSHHISSVNERSLRNQFRLECLNFILQILYGKRISPNEGSNTLQANATTINLSMQPPTIYRVETVQHYYEESETTSFSTTGTVKCQDGREISFNLEAEMSREFVEYYGYESFEEIKLQDPLVINLNGNLPEVSDQKFKFDIDNDGIEDKISRLIAGSGFLAYDQNEDGIINNGSELFGTKSGNGFSELAEYDLDNNGWIDENDDIFDKLKVWSFDEDGNESLIDLKKAGVGAIYLGSVATDFSINELETNETLAQVRRTGMFLFENGNVGAIQQMDMAL